MISVVIPCYNEEEVINKTAEELLKAMNAIGEEYELIFVNDGSKDGTLDMLFELSRQDPRIKVIGLSRNFGHQLATSAGIDYANGDAVILIDADLQDPPEVMGEMIQKWKNGCDVVYGRRLERLGETRFKTFTAKAFYRFLNQFSEVKIPLDTGDFRLMDRRVVEVLKNMPEQDRFLRGMVSWIGFNQDEVNYQRNPRFAGESKYPLRKMIKFAINGIISFSDTPLKLATYFGFFTAFISIVGIIIALFVRIFTNVWVQGWTTTIITIMFFSGVQLITVGIIGEYVARIYKASKARPLYIVKDMVGFDKNTRR